MPDLPQIVLRARALCFHHAPSGLDDTGSFAFIADAGIEISDGKIIKVSEWRDDLHACARVIDHRPHLIMPGFVDPHIHFPQLQVIASWGATLLEWLERHTFPEEQKFSDPTHCRVMADLFFDFLVRHGTTTACVFCSVHRESAEALFAAAQRRNICVVAGNVLMDRGAPPRLCQPPGPAYEDSKAIIARWHGKGRAHYAITPRFAITSTPELLDTTRALTKEHPDCIIQTHLSENPQEIELTAQLFPDSRDYLDVYDSYGLLGPRSLFAHVVHPRDRELDRLAETRSVAVFCPTSNLFLGSGLFDDEAIQQKGIRQAIATDVGGGTSYSMLRTLDEGYKVVRLQGKSTAPLRAFYQATRGNAEALGLARDVGTFEPGSAADLIVLNARATPEMALRMECAQTLAEELFILQTMGDDRAVVETYIAGQPAKSVLNGGQEH